MNAGELIVKTATIRYAKAAAHDALDAYFKAPTFAEGERLWLVFERAVGDVNQLLGETMAAKEEIMSAPGGWWNGLSKDGSPVGMDHGQLMEWAIRNDMQITIGWRCDFTFPEDKVSSPKLKGARMVRKGPDRDTFEEAARKAGWLDMAEKFKAAGL